MKYKQDYPTDGHGLAIPLEELGIETAQIIDGNREGIEMHHMYWSAYAYTQNLVRMIFAQLEVNIEPLEIVTHKKEVHDKFIGVRVPPFATMMSVIVEQYEEDGLMYPLERKTRNPHAITPHTMRTVKREYNRLRRYEP